MQQIYRTKPLKYLSILINVMYNINKCDVEKQKSVTEKYGENIIKKLVIPYFIAF